MVEAVSKMESKEDSDELCQPRAEFGVDTKCYGKSQELFSAFVF